MISEATCILSVLAAAFEDASTLTRKGENSEFDNRTGGLMAGALDGVGTLVNLAGFLLTDDC